MSIYFAAGIIARRKRGLIQYLVQDSEYRDGRIETKFPGGMNMHVDSSNPFRTLEEELEEETGLTIKSDVNPELILKTDSEPTMYFFFLWRSKCKGTIRKITIRDGTSVLRPPEWLDADSLRERLYRTHQPVIPKLERRGLI